MINARQTGKLQTLSKAQWFWIEIFAAKQLETFLIDTCSLLFYRALFGYDKNTNTLKVVETGGIIL